MTTFPKKEASIVSITMFLALAAVTPKCLAASLILNPVLAQSAPPVSFELYHFTFTAPQIDPPNPPY